MKLLFALIALFAMTASAADVTGTWKASVETQNGPTDVTFVFKVDGAKLTGTTTLGQMGESAISEGKVDGDAVTFAVVRSGGNAEFRINYTGKVNGDEMKISATVVGMDRNFEMNAKRAK